MVGRSFGCVALVVAGCGLDVVGQGDPSDATAAPPVATGEGGAGADAGAPPVTATCGAVGVACTSGLPDGFQPFALASDGPCPIDFEPVDVVTEPSAGPGACACSCAIDPSDPPSCAKGSFVPNVGASACIGPSNITYNVNGTGCTAVSASGLTIVAYSQILLFPFAPGKCTSSAASDLTKVLSKSLRLCKPTPACAEDVCQGNVPPTFGACVAHDGDVPCPGAPFAKRTLVGARATLACAGCTSCANKGTCGPGTFRYYGDTACTNEVATRVADGQCHALATGTVTGFSRFRYDVPVQQPGCDVTSSPTASVAVEQPMTVCCR